MECEGRGVAMGDLDRPLEHIQNCCNRGSGNRDGLTVYSIVGCRKIKEEQIWEIRGKKTKTKGNNRKRTSIVQRKNDN